MLCGIYFMLGETYLSDTNKTDVLKNEPDYAVHIHKPDMSAQSKLGCFGLRLFKVKSNFVFFQIRKHSEQTPGPCRALFVRDWRTGWVWSFTFLFCCWNTDPLTVTRTVIVTYTACTGSCLWPWPWPCWVSYPCPLRVHAGMLGTRGLGSSGMVTFKDYLF
jgi:hypothetical protein